MYNKSILVQILKVQFGVSLRLNTWLGYIHHFENVQKVYESSHLVECTFFSWWLGGSCCILLQLHFCCSLLLSDDINNLKNIWMWFAHDSLQLGVPAFDMIVLGPS